MAKVLVAEMVATFDEHEVLLIVAPVRFSIALKRISLMLTLSLFVFGRTMPARL